MGGRGGGKENEWLTIPIYRTTSYYFDGKIEKIHNITSTFGKHDNTAYFETNESGTTLNYYIADGTYEYIGSGNDMRMNVVPYKAYFASLNLLQYSQGHSYRIERVLIGKARVWANRDYPDWALKI